MSDWIKEATVEELLDEFDSNATSDSYGRYDSELATALTKEILRRLPFWRNLDSCAEGEYVLLKTAGGNIYCSFYNGTTFKDMNPHAIAWMPLNVVLDAPMESKS